MQIVILALTLAFSTSAADKCLESTAAINTKWKLMLDNFQKDPVQDQTRAQELVKLCTGIIMQGCTSGNTYYGQPMLSECQKLVTQSAQARTASREELQRDFDKHKKSLISTKPGQKPKFPPPSRPPPPRMVKPPQPHLQQKKLPAAPVPPKKN